MIVDYKIPLFELRGPAGELWVLWADGRTTGFPDGTRVLNRAAPLIHVLLGKQKIPGPHAADQHAETFPALGLDAGIGAEGTCQRAGARTEVDGDDVLS